MKKQKKFWFCGMSGPSSIENLQELLEPIKDYFNGIVWVLHDSRDSQESKYLESIKGEGKIIHYEYHQRHDISRNHYLWCGPIKNGDWVMVCDDLERLNTTFVKSFQNIVEEIFIPSNINMGVYYGKPLLFEYHESLVYQGSPHEGLFRRDGLTSAREIKDIWPVETDVRYNVRPFKRKEPFHWVRHFARYMLMPWGSNHALLHLELRAKTREEFNKLFQERESLRVEFLNYLDERGIERNVDAVIKLFSSTLDDRLKKFINNEKVWNDLYRLYVLDDNTIQDEHLWTSMKKF
jgi:hypothetical protein